MTTTEIMLKTAVRDYVATSAIQKVGPGFVSDIWVSRYLDSSEALVVVGHVNIPIYGNTLSLASSSAGRMAEAVIDFLEHNSNGDGPPGGKPDDPQHYYEHLEAYRDRVESSGLTVAEQTVVYYQFLSEFHAPNPAVVIAQHQGIGSVRTVHDRVARARATGYLESYGRGRSHS